MQCKIRICDACVMSNLLYCLHTAWLSSAELRKLDAFQARCLRRISGIAHSFVSRISNETILHNTAQLKLSNIILRRQMTLMAKVAIQPDLDILRSAVFKPSSFALIDDTFERARGRPRACWPREVYKHCVAAVGNVNLLSSFWQTTAAAQKAWIALVKQYCVSL